MHCFVLSSPYDLTNASSDLFMLASATVVDNKKKLQRRKNITRWAIMGCNLGKQTVD